MIGYHIAPRKRELSFSVKKIGVNIITANRHERLINASGIKITGGGRETLAG